MDLRSTANVSPQPPPRHWGLTQGQWRMVVLIGAGVLVWLMGLFLLRHFGGDVRTGPVLGPLS
jgi:hypothetical protein